MRTTTKLAAGATIQTFETKLEISALYSRKMHLKPQEM